MKCFACYRIQKCGNGSVGTIIILKIIMEVQNKLMLLDRKHPSAYSQIVYEKLYRRLFKLPSTCLVSKGPNVQVNIT